MSNYSPDTIRILVSTDNHVGYAEGDGPRTNDSWRTFDEVLNLAASHDVDMVLLAGDLFHENHPSRKALIEVMKSLREHCQGDRPCALDIIGDQTEQFPGFFNRANYLDPNINVSIPVFSIHGNHDDPTGADHTAALDLLHTAGLINYYGHVLEVDKIQIKPILMQKGTTKLALYGLSNVRDERLFQTFRDHKVTFYNPPNSKRDWYNILSVHQNHTPHTDSSYLPESSLPENMDLVIWGHEHECKINPRLNPEMGFKVMQPGSTIATSLIPGESVPKHVAILSITGKECKTETIRLKSVRPFVYKDIILRDEKKMKDIAHKADNLAAVKQYCKSIINGMIKEAKQDWLDHNEDASNDPDEELEIPLPLIRLRVEYTAPAGGGYKVEQNQRFSQEYRDQVANINDVIQFHRRRTNTTRRNGAKVDAPDEEALEQLALEDIKVNELVREFLTAQSLKLLPQNLFSDAVTQYVDKGDKKAIELFVKDSLKVQVDNLVVDGKDDSEEEAEDKIQDLMNTIKEQQEERFRKGEIRARKGNAKKLLPRPAEWDSDDQGHWSDYPGAQAGQEGEEEDDSVMGDEDASEITRGRGGRGGRGGRARGRAGRAATTASTRKPAAKKVPAKPAAKGRAKKKPIEEDSEEASDVMIIDDDDEDEAMADNSGGLFVSQASSAPRSTASHATTTRTAAPARTAAAANRQSTLSFGGSESTARTTGARAATSRAPARRQEPSDDEIDDDDDAFEPAVTTARGRRR